MKKLIVFSAVMLACISCVNEINSCQFENDGKIIITAISDATKTHLGTPSEGVVPVLFDAVDELFVCSSTSTGARFTTSADAISNDGTIAEFSGSLDMSGPFCAVFPFEYTDSSTDIDRIVVNVPATQTYNATSFGITSNIAAACWSDGTTFSLKSLGGCLEASFLGEGVIKKVVLEGNDADFPLWGVCTAIPDPSTGDLTDIEFSNDAADKNILTMTLDTPAVLSAESALDFYFTVPEGAFEKGMTMSIYDDSDNLVQMVSTAKNLKLTRASISKMKAIDIRGIMFSGGSGTESDPYRIAKAADLIQMAALVNAGTGSYATANYIQTKDITDAAITNHIGSYGSNNDHPFKGVYDGAGFKITNVSFTAATDEIGQGLFGSIKDATIKNLTVENFTNNSKKKYTGVIAGVSNTSIVKNCTVRGEITIKGSQAGLVGRNNSVVQDCSFNGNFYAFDTCIGAIVGLNASDGTVSNCKAAGTVSSTTNAAGGIVGLCESGSVDAITACEFNGNVISEGRNIGGILGMKANRNGGVQNCKMTGTVSGTYNIGGIIGSVLKNNDSAKPGVLVSNCVNSAKVMGTLYNIAGIIGYANPIASGNYTKVDKCVNNGDITGAYNIGGIIGSALDKGDYITIINSVVSDCTLYATSADPSNHYARVGGIIGGTDKNSTAAVNILNSCTLNINLKSDDTGDTTNHRVNGFGGIVGSHFCNGSIACCYSNVVDSNFSVPNGTIYYKGAIVGYNKASLASSNYYDSACSYKAFFDKNPCQGIETAKFTDGTLLTGLNYYAVDIEEAATWKEGTGGFPIPTGAEADPHSATMTTIRIMAIGNSFTQDAVEQNLYEIFRNAGYNAILGNCYIGGCSLETHWKNESSTDPSKKSSNSYRKIVKGILSTSGSKSVEYILKDEPWDYIIFQQGAGSYGIVESHYPYLDNFLSYIAGILTPGTYKTGYQQNWAYPKSCTDDRFALYDYDQDKMYAACVDCAATLKTRSSLDLIIPTGTAIQNGRTSSLGDTFNRDWGHLDYNYGRYTASLTWFEAISGIDATTITWKPETVTEEQAIICRKAAHDAVMTPGSVTEQ